MWRQILLDVLIICILEYIFAYIASMHWLLHTHSHLHNAFSHTLKYLITTLMTAIYKPRTKNFVSHYTDTHLINTILAAFTANSSSNSFLCMEMWLWELVWVWSGCVRGKRKLRDEVKSLRHSADLQNTHHGRKTEQEHWSLTMRYERKEGKWTSRKETQNCWETRNIRGDCNVHLTLIFS